MLSVFRSSQAVARQRRAAHLHGPRDHHPQHALNSSLAHAHILPQLIDRPHTVREEGPGDVRERAGAPVAGEGALARAVGRGFAAGERAVPGHDHIMSKAQRPVWMSERTVGRQQQPKAQLTESVAHQPTSIQCSSISASCVLSARITLIWFSSEMSNTHSTPACPFVTTSAG